MPTETSYLHGVVDIGSNGIRFSITDLSPPAARTLPTLYQGRVSISLYDAQFPVDSVRRPISRDVIDYTTAHLAGFRAVCSDFNVPDENIHILATEAVRIASNYGEFISGVRKGTDGWATVRILSKEDEGRIGALGVVSSLASEHGATRGLVMDLGGGSLQLTQMTQDRNKTPPVCLSQSMSLPYGAAALKLRIQGGNGKEKRAERLKEEMKASFRQACHQLNIREPLTDESGGLNLYLTGGGFRGWGYLLMSRAAVNPYPIPIVNGYVIGKEEFCNMDSASVLSESGVRIFGISKRRMSQIPAVAVLIDALTEALPAVNRIQFCHGGVREGFLFDKLPIEVQTQDPLIAATLSYASASCSFITDLFQSAMPANPSLITSSLPPSSFSTNLIRAVGNLLFAHASIHKGTRAAAALRSTTTGILTSSSGLTHTGRTLVALILCERWAGNLAPADKIFRDSLYKCISAKEGWWARYLGQVGKMIGDVYPSGVVPESGRRLRLAAEWEDTQTKEGHCDVLVVKAEYRGTDEIIFRELLREAGERITKLGKKKNRQAGGERLRVVATISVA